MLKGIATEEDKLAEQRKELEVKKGSFFISICFMLFTVVGA